MVLMNYAATVGLDVRAPLTRYATECRSPESLHKALLAQTLKEQYELYAEVIDD